MRLKGGVTIFQIYWVQMNYLKQAANNGKTKQIIWSFLIKDLGKF